MNRMTSKIVLGLAALVACFWCTAAVAAPQHHATKHKKHKRHVVKHHTPASVTHSRAHSTNSMSMHGTKPTTNPGHTKPKDDVDKASRETNHYANGASKNINHEVNRESKDFNHGVNDASKAINHALQGKKKKG